MRQKLALADHTQIVSVNNEHGIKVWDINQWVLIINDSGSVKTYLG